MRKCVKGISALPVSACKVIRDARKHGDVFAIASRMTALLRRRNSAFRKFMAPKNCSTI
jgi:hypothetical protein